MSSFLKTLKKILRRKEDPSYFLSAEWVLEQVKRPSEITPKYDDTEMTPDQVRAIENYRHYKVSARAVYLRCTKLMRSIPQDQLIEKAIAACCEDACLRTTSLRVTFTVRFY